MRAYIIAAICAASFAVSASERVAKQGDDVARLSEKPCTNELVLARMPKDVAKEFRAATGFFQGQHYQACWRMVGNAAFLVYEDGDQGVIPANELKEDSGV